MASRLTRRRPMRGERGVALVGVLILAAALLGVAALAAFSSYTNLLVATNFRGVARAKANAETSLNEALYRLTLPDTDPAAIVPVLTDPNWNVGIYYTTGDNDPSDHTVSTIRTLGDWPANRDAQAPAVTLQYKKDASGNVIFYDRATPSPNPPFMTVALPGPIGPIVGTVYELLCFMPSVLGIQVGGILGLCPANVPATGYPVIQLRATGLDARGARRDLLAETSRSITFPPLAPLMAGGNVNLNSNGFLDGVNHDHRIYLTGAGTAAAIYGDDDNETTNNIALLGLPVSVKDSPDDFDVWNPLLPLGWLTTHGIANASLIAYVQTPFYQSFPRPFNMAVSSTDLTPAWVGVSKLTQALTSSLSVPGMGTVPAAQLGIWTGVNFGYSAPIALAPTATISNPPAPGAGNIDVWRTGVFSWRISNKNEAGAQPYPGSVNLTAPAANTVVECGPTVGGAAPPLVCRPAALTTFPLLQDYLGLEQVKFDALLASPTTSRADLDAGHAPVGFTYVNGDYTLAATTPSPTTNQFGILYVRGNLTVQGLHTFKGLIFVDGSISIAAGGHLVVLGAVMVRSTFTNVGTGKMTLVFSREAALRGVINARPWRLLSWADTAITQ